MADTLYHYCSAQTFHALFSSNQPTIRLSSLSLSNDSMEGIWLRKVFGELCIEEGLGIENVTAATNYLESLTGKVDGLGFCMSAQADMLSQWRGYADDAKGFCVGFSRSYLETLHNMKPNHLGGVKLEEVIYSRNEQVALLKPMVQSVRTAIERGAFRQTPPFRMVLDSRSDEEIAQESANWREALNQLGISFFEAYLYMFRLKNFAFQEEREWRLLALFTLDQGGLQYYAKSDRLVPYASLFLNSPSSDAIKEVIIGPRNITPISVVEGFLKSTGFSNATVRKSDASYR